MPRVHAVVASLVLTLLLAAPAQAAPKQAKDPKAGARAGVAVLDATWNVGASAGQFTEEAGPVSAEAADPHLHTTKKRLSDGVGLRTSTRALVVQGSSGGRIAIVSTDLYLPQDLLTRRVASLLEARDRRIGLGLQRGHRTGITADKLAVTASHNHNTPFYSTPGWGTAIFQDVFDVRFYDYMATRMARAVIRAAGRMVPVRMGGATSTFNEIQGHTYGPKVADDGTPAGQPFDHTTKQVSVVTFDDISDPRRPRPFVNWVVFGVHPEFTWGYDLINGDITHATARMVDRELGTVSVFSQRETGTSGPHKGTRAHPASARREFEDNGFNQLDRGARLLADGILETRRDIVEGTPERRSAYQRLISDFEVSSVATRVAPPATRPYPGVSNCNTMSLFHGDPRLPILGLPDCAKTNDYGTAPLTDVVRPVTAPLYDQLKDAGVPIPESYSATALTGVEETAAVHLMAIRLGGIGVTVSPSEQFTDTARNIESRLDKLEGNLYTGWDWTEHKTPAGRDWCVPGADAGTWSCADPRNPSGDPLPPVPDVALRRLRAQIHNDARGWEDEIATLGSEAEPADPAAIKGNFTHEELDAYGYDLVLAVGMANDYWGYMPEYREYRAHDHYRKALAGLGPHGADFLATRLTRLAASLNGGPRLPAAPLDTAFAAEQARAQVLADGLGAAGRAYGPVYERQLPADGGTPAITTQPKDTRRFGATHLVWTGGSNYADLPVISVQRKDDGRWRPYGDTHGDVQLMVRFPRPEQLGDWRAGAFAWQWTAAFEAFSSDISQPDAEGVQREQTPAGTYRFLVRGHHRGAAGAKATPYTLRSQEFTVAPYDGLTAEDLRVEPDGTVSFRPGGLDYPDSYASPFRFINPTIQTLAGERYCTRCAFRPWADRGTLERALVTFDGGDGGRARTVTARPQADGRWRTSAELAPGGGARVAAGDLRDGFGETNGAPSATVTR